MINFLSLKDSDSENTWKKLFSCWYLSDFIISIFSTLGNVYINYIVLWNYPFSKTCLLSILNNFGNFSRLNFSFQIPLFHKCNKETLTKLFKQKNSSSSQTGIINIVQNFFTEGSTNVLDNLKVFLTSSLIYGTIRYVVLTQSIAKLF